MRIKKLSYLDYPKIKKLIPYLGSNDGGSSVSALLELPSGILNDILPQKYMFKEESYMFSDGDEILGMITVEPTAGNPYKINISRLVFKQDYYDIGKQLVDFVIAKYGAKGAHAFTVFVDISHDELCTLFVDGCGFRQCAYENLWKLDNFTPESKNISPFRPCQNTDAKEIITTGAGSNVIYEEATKDKANTKPEKININTADAAKLQTLPGIGAEMAKKIIEHRKNNGKFKTIEEFKNVPGIGESKFNALKDLIKIQ